MRISKTRERQACRGVVFGCRQQRSIASGSRGIDRDDLLSRKSPEVVGPTRLRAGSGETGTTERLGANHGADHVAIDIDISGCQPRSNVFDHRINAGMDAKREAIAVRGDLIEQRIELIGAPAHDVKYRPEHFLLQITCRARITIVGGTNVPTAGKDLDASQRNRTRCCPAIMAIHRSRLFLASASITGPTWVAGSRGSPTFSSSAAPAIISTRRSATSSCTHRRRSAEQRWHAERKTELMTSSTTCSGNAVASTIMALMPPVSAIKGTIAASFAASVRWIERATSVEPVNAMPATWESATSAAPILPSPGTRWTALAGMPASCRMRTACAAMRGVCSAGFATTELPATRAAPTWPRNIASGKFHGLMQTKTPRPR